jgi:hypothetical protein
MHVTHVTCALFVSAEGLATLMTDEWMFARVDGHVHLEVGPMLEPKTKIETFRFRMTGDWRIASSQRSLRGVADVADIGSNTRVNPDVLI